MRWAGRFNRARKGGGGGLAPLPDSGIHDLLQLAYGVAAIRVHSVANPKHPLVCMPIVRLSEVQALPNPNSVQVPVSAARTRRLPSGRELGGQGSGKL